MPSFAVERLIYPMKFTFVLKEDILELCGAAATLYCLYFTWRLSDPVGLFFAAIFGIGSAYFYHKKNKARWCVRCKKLMVYGTEPSEESIDHDVVYTCKICGIKNRANVSTEYPNK